MQTNKRVQTLVPLLIALLLIVGGTTVQGSAGSTNEASEALGTAFTYQGQLTQNGNPVNSTCDLQFGLWDALIGGSQIGVAQTKTNVSVANGLFTIPDLDFGTSAFDGNARWIEIAVRCPAGSGSYATLSPRQALTAAPYAVYATNAAQLGGVDASQYVLTTDARLSDARPPTAGSTNYIQNGTTSQTGANFSIDGNGTVSGMLSASKVGVGTTHPSYALSLDGQSAQTAWMERNTTSNSAGNSLTIQAGGATTGATDKPGGDLVLAAGVGTGTGGSGNVRVQTAGSTGTSGTSDNIFADRIIVVSKAKAMTLAAPGFTALLSIHLVGTETAGGSIHYTIRATDGGSQVATESGEILYLATANSITCTVQSTTKLHLGTVNSGCTPGFFNPGSQPGVSIYDNVSFSSPAPIVVHEVYFTIENDSGAPIRLEP